MGNQLTLQSAFTFLLSFVLVVTFLPLEMGEAAPDLQSLEDDWPMYQHDPAHSGRTPATAFNNGPLYLQWAYAFGERVEVEAQPVISGGVIYQGVMNGEIHAIDADTGAARWIVTPGGPIPHTAAVYGRQGLLWLTRWQSIRAFHCRWPYRLAVPHRRAGDVGSGRGGRASVHWFQRR